MSSRTFQIFEQIQGNDICASDQEFATAEAAAEEAKRMARENDGTIYRVFPVGGDVARFEALNDTWHWV